MLPIGSTARAWCLTLVTTLAGCSAPPSDDAQSGCDADCESATALRSLRETMKLVYNLSLQGQPAGEQNETVACPDGGLAHVSGNASSDPERGTTKLYLEYDFEGCRYEQHTPEPSESYSLAIAGTVLQRGILAGPAQTTTALVLESAALTLLGSVYDPPREYRAEECELSVTQEGDRVSGTLCEDDVSVDL